MKKIIISISLLTLIINSKAQDTIKVYMNDEYIQTDFSDATIMREAIINNDSYIFIDKTIKGNMINYCEFKSIEPRIEHGLAIHYKSPDDIYSKGYYENGKLSGIWYYYRNNNIIDSANYTIAGSYNKEQDCQIEGTKPNLIY